MELETRSIKVKMPAECRFYPAKPLGARRMHVFALALALVESARKATQKTPAKFD